MASNAPSQQHEPDGSRIHLEHHEHDVRQGINDPSSSRAARTIVLPQLETRSASASSDQPSQSTTASKLPQADAGAACRARNVSLDTTRPRALSAASTSSTRSVRSLKRKPLPSSASPLATRFSLEERLIGSIATTIQPPYTGSLSGDSPILYENPLTTPFKLLPSPVEDDYMSQRKTSDGYTSDSNHSSSSTSHHPTHLSPNLQPSPIIDTVQSVQPEQPPHPSQLSRSVLPRETSQPVHVDQSIRPLQVPQTIFPVQDNSPVHFTRPLELPPSAELEQNLTPSRSLHQAPPSPAKEHSTTTATTPSPAPDQPSSNSRKLGTATSQQGTYRLSSTSEASQSTAWYDDNQSSAQSRTMSIFSSKPIQPVKITLPTQPVPRLDESHDILNINKQLPRSPGASKLGAFFGWGGNTSPAGSSTTSFSEDRAYSPIPSPTIPQALKRSTSTQRSTPAGIETANANENSYLIDSYLQIPPTSPGSATHVDEMEEELKAITAELATSIRREMDLEDLVERLQAEAAIVQGSGRRTSDYFSDSGTSSVRYGGDADAKAEELERLQRKTEREKASIRLELTDKVRDERSQRKRLEAQISTLEARVSQAGSLALHPLNSADRLKELESNCEDLRRRLAEERQVKENFEDLLTALKGELQVSHNERDNLRDEIVPQLRARVEGLEAQAAQHEKISYENSRMQQEMQALKTENISLANARKAQINFSSISEGTPPTTPAFGLSRSNTTLGIGGARGGRGLTLTRSASVKAVESKDVVDERIKDVESQRDALHRALKSLLERQEHQARTNDRRVKQLEMERDRALAMSPRKTGFNQEVIALREEINKLRRRADEAIEQKWLCEKGLSGLKMDLDRAEQEIASLRGMLAEASNPSTLGSKAVRNSVTSESLERAYSDLQRSYDSALERVRDLESANSGKDTETESALTALEQSLSQALSERDSALTESEHLQSINANLNDSEREHLHAEIALADELRGTAKRVEDLAIQVRQQLASNATLRQRLAETIDRGEQEQKANAVRIASMQSKLRALEEELVNAQHISEEHVSAHEQEIQTLKDAHSSQLQRMRDGIKSPRVFSPKSPMSPMFANKRSPQIGTTSSGRGMSVSEESKVTYLRARVEELEHALEEADREMEEVVGRMNSAQIEVMELWNEREEAVRVTRRLEKEIEEEKKRGGRWLTT